MRGDSNLGFAYDCVNLGHGCPSPRLGKKQCTRDQRSPSQRRLVAYSQSQSVFKGINSIEVEVFLYASDLELFVRLDRQKSTCLNQHKFSNMQNVFYYP